MSKPMILKDEFLEFCQQILYNGVFVELAGAWQGGLVLFMFLRVLSWFRLDQSQIKPAERGCVGERR